MFKQAAILMGTLLLIQGIGLYKVPNAILAVMGLIFLYWIMVILKEASKP